MKTKYALCAMLACIASAVALGQQVSVNYNKSQNFSQYHTYIWASDNANQIQNSILAQQAKSDIDSALQARASRWCRKRRTLTSSSSQAAACNSRPRTGVGYARIWRRNGQHHSRAERDRNLDCRPLRGQEQVPGLARNCPKYAEQQWQQELADGIQGRRRRCSNNGPAVITVLNGEGAEGDPL